MFHGSSEIVNWLVGPVKYFIEWVQWPFRVISSHF